MNPKLKIYSALKYALLFGALSTLCTGCFIWSSGDNRQPSTQRLLLAGGERGTPCDTAP